jgi:hypothetical protein
LAASQLWRGNWNEKIYPRPKQSQESRLDEFIKQTYFEKKFYAEKVKFGIFKLSLRVTFLKFNQLLN